MRRRFLVISLIVILVLVIANALLTRATAPKQVITPDTTPTPVSETLHSLVPGSQSPSLSTQNSGFVVEREENDQQVAEFKSANPLINDEVIVKDGQVKMKKILAKDSTGKNPTIEQYFRTNGEAELTAFDIDYGTQVFVWPQKGLAAAGSRELDELFRTYTFEPMSIEQFKSEFASEFDFEQGGSESLGY